MMPQDTRVATKIQCQINKQKSPFTFPLITKLIYIHCKNSKNVKTSHHAQLPSSPKSVLLMVYLICCLTVSESGIWPRLSWVLCSRSHKAVVNVLVGAGVSLEEGPGGRIYFPCNYRTRGGFITLL